MRTWTLHFRYEEAHSSCFPGLSRLLGFPRVLIRFRLFAREREPRAFVRAPRGCTRALVSSLTILSPPRFSTASRLARGPLSKRAVKERRRETHKTAAAAAVCRVAVRAPAVSVAASSHRRTEDDRDGEREGGEREEETPPSFPSLPATSR